MTSSELQYKKMTETPIPKLILSLGLPTTLSMLVTNIYNMAGTGSEPSDEIGVSHIVNVGYKHA